MRFVKKSLKILVLVLTVSTILWLNGCHSTVVPFHDRNVQNIHQTLTDAARNNSTLSSQTIPTSINSALLPNIAQGHTQTEPTRFDVSVKNMPAKDFFMSLIDGTQDNIIVSPKITGEISLQLKHVTLEETLAAIRNIYGFEYTKTQYGYSVFPRRLESRIFVINHLNISRLGRSQTDLNSSGSNSSTSSGQLGSNRTQGVSLNTETNSEFWKELEKSIQMLIRPNNNDFRSSQNSNPGQNSNSGQNLNQATTAPQPSVSVNPESGIIAVKAYPSQLRAVEHYLMMTQSIIGRQVIIEANILEVQLSQGFNYGIDWSIMTDKFSASYNQSSTTGTVQNPLLRTGYGNIFKVGTSSGDFQSAIDMLSTQGDVSVLSKPRVSTLNNQKAIIKVGTDSYFVTGVQNDVTSNNFENASQASIDLQPFFSGIALEVIPQIDAQKHVTLHIHPIVSLVKTKVEQVKVNNRNNAIPTAETTVRESDSVVKAKSGQIIIIGGLMQTLSDLRRSSLPGLSKLNTLNKSLTTKKDGAVKTEMVILLKPIVINNSNTWIKEIKNTANRFAQKPTE